MQACCPLCHKYDLIVALSHTHGSNLMFALLTFLWMPILIVIDFINCLLIIKKTTSHNGFSWWCQRHSGWQWTPPSYQSPPREKGSRFIVGHIHVICLVVNMIWFIEIHHDVMWDWHYFTKYFPYSNWLWGMFYGILSISQKFIMDLSNVMNYNKNFDMCCRGCTKVTQVFPNLGLIYTMDHKVGPCKMAFSMVQFSWFDLFKRINIQCKWAPRWV